jgi:hypothetical protein
MPGARYNQRYYQIGYPASTSGSYNLTEIRALGCNIVNMHANTRLNPWIDYPWDPTYEAPLARFTAQASDLGMKVKYYYTVGQLSSRAYELFFLRSLGDEVISGGQGGGQAWCQEHLHSGYQPDWSTPNGWGIPLDQAISDDGTSRMANWYVRSVQYAAETSPKIDGLYLDGTSIDRMAMLRVARAMAIAKPGCLVDLHTPDMSNIGLTSAVLQYSDHLAWIDKGWFGELYPYRTCTPEFWLTEISLVPFGVPNDMLGAPTTIHIYKGLLFASTGRADFSGPSVSAIWRVWCARTSLRFVTCC